MILRHAEGDPAMATEPVQRVFHHRVRIFRCHLHMPRLAVTIQRDPAAKIVMVDRADADIRDVGKMAVMEVPAQKGQVR